MHFPALNCGVCCNKLQMEAGPSPDKTLDVVKKHTVHTQTYIHIHNHRWEWDIKQWSLIIEMNIIFRLINTSGRKLREKEISKEIPATV